MSFAAARDYLRGTINSSPPRQPARLERTRAILRALGNPQTRYPALHVGGTSGKGSTATMLARALEASGKRTGLHAKPHLGSMTERMRIDGTAVGEDELAALLEETRPILDRVASEFGNPTYDEILLILSFAHFARANVDVAVIEVGAGGTLDGTNVLLPQVSVITNVGFDQTEIAGNALEDIALDKAGIAKRGVPLVSDVYDSAARRQIEQTCAHVGAPFLSVRDLVEIEDRSGERYGQSFVLCTPADRYVLSLPVLGRFQQRNAATAILALEQLEPELRPSHDDIVAAMATLVLPGRMEFFPSYPPVIFDIAHNPDKARSLVDSLLETFAARRFTTVVAIGENKDAKGFLRELSRLPASFVFTAFESTGRSSMRPSRVAGIAGDLGMWGREVNDPVEALSIARRSAAAEDIVLVTGSTYVVGLLRDWWFQSVVAQEH